MSHELLLCPDFLKAGRSIRQTQAIIVLYKPWSDNAANSFDVTGSNRSTKLSNQQVITGGDQTSVGTLIATTARHYFFKAIFSFELQTCE
jgi:hypothetical protein